MIRRYPEERTGKTVVQTNTITIPIVAKADVKEVKAYAVEAARAVNEDMLRSANAAVEPWDFNP
jgi:hypothetical protein